MSSVADSTPHTEYTEYTEYGAPDIPDGLSLSATLAQRGAALATAPIDKRYAREPVSSTQGIASSKSVERRLAFNHAMCMCLISPRRFYVSLFKFLWAERVKNDRKNQTVFTGYVFGLENGTDSHSRRTTRPPDG